MNGSRDFNIIMEKRDDVWIVVETLVDAEVTACAAAAAKYQETGTKKNLRHLCQAVHAFRQQVKAPQVVAVLLQLEAQLTERLTALTPQWLAAQHALPSIKPLDCRPQVLLNAPNA
ncbi:hypothetical protein [uncultured Deinococcus sp.]|uniref:hypothetical protein n=1 Tax=uncultured Deinococcus sp. TaxID=158789 RepID=UPI00258EBF6A|nr:hypothetical protein [uncultured Deinococcus sp.]